LLAQVGDLCLALKKQKIFALVGNAPFAKLRQQGFYLKIFMPNPGASETTIFPL
jgi:hypothetical protein